VRACLDPSHPARPYAARYLSATRLNTLCDQVLNNQTQQKASPTRKALISALIAASIVEPICQGDLDSPRVFWLKIRGGHREHHNPLEILASAHADAVISHHTCLAHHNLTTARPVAWLVSVPPSAQVASKTLGVLDELQLVGKQLSPHLRFGTVKVWTDADESVTVFDVERVMIAALDTPQLHGGPSAVVEAWETGADIVRQDVLVEYLERLNSAMLWRRVGAMAERLGLANVLAACETARAGMTDKAMIDNTLIVGAGVVGFNEQWKLGTPWA